MLAIHGLTMYLGLVPLPMARRGPTGFDRELWRLLNTLDSVVASLTGRPLTSKDPRRRR